MFPVFPLPRALLLPHSHLPLNIFEARYLNLVEEALRGGRMFGMIQPRSQAAGTAAIPAAAGLQRVGCLGRIGSFIETDDGCFAITLVGLARFDVVEEEPLRFGFRSVRASFARWAEDLQPPRQPAIDRSALLDGLRQFFASRRLDANWAAIETMSDAQLVDTLCMACPFGDPEKQALLESPTGETRARDLLALLAFARHEQDGDGPRHVS